MIPKKMIPVADTEIGLPEARAGYEVIRSRWLSQGQKVRDFEAKFTKAVDGSETIAVNNGTSALHLALMALEVGPGDEVIVPSLTFISSANVVLYQGAKLVLADCDPRTYNITPEEIKKKLSWKTKAVMPVDMNGMPCDYAGIRKICRSKKVSIIADSAESLGASYKGNKVGSIEDIHCFSFFPNKNITTGEGGAIVTKNKSLAKKMRIIRNQGQDWRYHHVELGYNYRMTELQAAIGIAQLDRLTGVIKTKEKIAEYYTQAFEGSAVGAPFVPEYVTQHAWYMYSISVAAKIRDRFVMELEKRNIQTRLSFPPIHIQPYYIKKYGFKSMDFPDSFKSWSSKMDIPIFKSLKKSEQDYVIRTILELQKKLI